MLNSSKTSKQFFAVFAAVTVAVTADIVSNDNEQTAIASEAPIVAAPAEITGIQAPVVGFLSSLEDARLSVPALSKPALSPPAMPDLELVVWGARGVIPAPTTVIEVEAPDVGDLPSLEDAGSRGHSLVKPPLPSIGH